MRALLGCLAAMVVAPGCGDADRSRPASDATTNASGATASTRDPTPFASDSGASRTTDATPTRRKRILFVGTSLTAGYGLDTEDAYPALIANRIDSLGLNYEVVNAGVSGETSAGALRRMDWLLRAPVDVLVLETGANDGLRGLTVNAMRANIEAIIDRVRAAHATATILLVGMEAPTNLGQNYTARFRRVYPELAAGSNAMLVPFLLEGVAGIDTLNLPDGVHPNERGQRIVAETVWRVLKGALGQPG